MARKEQATAAPLVPDEPTLETLREAAAECRACDLWKGGTQTVFGEGDVPARLMLVGEQPGDREDVEGHPFVGPAGRVLASGLEEAGLDRERVYITNTVKHFKWVPKGKRRVSQKPNVGEIRACRPWLEAEIEVVRPRVIVCLGATAAQALIGREFRVTKQRGEPLDSPLARYIMATVHPASVLRTPTDEGRHEAMRRFVEDLRRVVPLLEE